MDKLFDENYGMFIKKNDRYWWINRDSFESNIQFELLGTLVGIAMYNEVLLDLNFPIVFYKKLLNENL